ncbi:hypothetical protein [Chelatococcus asaccharovorans]|uniref:hypothetical protein n=1 Tax=Chelatococcus asaccharovorans TaxID=28210 RepID=UPI00224C70E1|nr:hypothetical protein [Chelatococcus asaccharovorans]CAH1671482.1 hypothetical protein CHELA17_61244 [Chelatococcus asaccharovorans]
MMRVGAGLPLPDMLYLIEFDRRYPLDVDRVIACQIRKFHGNHKHPPVVDLKFVTEWIDGDERISDPKTARES